MSSTYDFVNRGMQEKLHSSLTLSNLWPQFVETIAKEVALIKDEDEKTKYYNDIYNLLEGDNIELANKFGYVPNLILNNSLHYIIQQNESIPFRIKKKTTYLGYEINFKMAERLGEIYNLFWNTNKLIKAIRWGPIFNSIESDFDPTVPFVSVAADRNFSSVNLMLGALMDDSSFLDEDPPLRMDSSAIILPTKHLAIEYITDKLVQRNNINYLYYDNYFKYLLQGSEYNRQVPVVPHNGCQLTIVLSDSGGYDFFNIGAEYSVPSLQLRSAVAFTYITRENVVEQLTLDSLGRTLDEPIVWTMDGSGQTEEPITINDMKYISVGGGRHNIPTTENSRILNDKSTMVLYYPLDDDNTSDNIKDYSVNNYSGSLVGERKKIQGIIGKTVNFTGNTYVTSLPTVVSSNYTINMWTKLDDTKNEHVLFDFDFINARYDFTTEELSVEFNALLIQVEVLQMENNHYIQIEIDKTNDELRVFVDANLLNTTDITGETFGGQHNLYIGTNNNQSLYAKGIIDDFSIYIKFFSQEQKNYIFNNRVGLIANLNNFYNRTSLEEVEKNESLSKVWMGVQSYNKANYVNDEFLFNYINDVTAYIGFTFFDNLEPFRVAINYTRLESGIPVTEKIYDNGDGKFEGTHVSGTIHYTSGQYLINTFSINRELYDVISSVPTSSVDTATQPYVQLGSLQILYSIGGTSYVAQDDTIGNIVGTGITLGTINYISGVVQITFSSTTDNEVYCRYLYKKTAMFNENDVVSIEYYTKNSLEVTEAAVEDENKNVLAYATFPPIEFNTFENHLSTLFLIRQV